MKEQLIDILGLESAATDEQVVAAVTELKDTEKAAALAAAGEKEIRALMAESGNALSRDAAMQVLASRKEAAKAATKKDKEKARK